MRGPGAARRPAPPSVVGDLREERGSPLKSQPRPAPPVPNTWRGTSVILVGGVGAGGNKPIYLPQLRPGGEQLTGCWGDRWGLEVPASVLPSWLGIREGPGWEITELTEPGL